MIESSAEIPAPRNRDPKQRYLNNAVQLTNPMLPWFDYVPLTTDTLTLRGRYTLNSDAPILIPFRQTASDYISVVPYMLQIDDSWTIDLDATSIDLTNRIGGIVDGLALATNTDYLIWAFADEYRNFLGFGLTARPRVTAASNTSGGGLGASGSTFDTGTGHGWRFSIGARVLIRAGTAASVSPATTGDSYNQGIITNVSSNSITVTMDSLYPDLELEQNTTLASLTGLEIIQLDNFAPRLYNQDSLYPGSGAAYQYSYIGSIQTNLSSNIRHVRKRNSWYGFPADVGASQPEWYHIFDRSSRSSSPFTVCLARWVAVGTKHVRGVLTIEGANVLAYVAMQTDADAPLWSLTGARTSGGGLSRVPYELLTRFHNTSAWIHLYTTAGSSMTGNAYLSGYVEEQF